MTGPDPGRLRPLPEHRCIAFLGLQAEGRANVSVGRYSYCDDPAGADRFFERNVLHHYDFVGGPLIGAFCTFATGTGCSRTGPIA